MYQVLRYKNVLFADSEIKLPAEDLPEVVTGKTHNPFYILMMLFYSVVLWFRNQSYIPTHAIRFWKVNIGQSSDSDEWVARYSEAWVPKEPVICFGVSRGALVTFKNAYFLAKIEVPKLVILEGCPDSIPDVIEARYGSVIGGAIEWALQLFTRYNAKRARQNSALSCVDDFPRGVPVAFITSEKDTTVPARNTLRLVDALIQSGHKQVHLLVLKHADHNSYITGHPEDREEYIEFVKDLRARYGC